MLIAPRGLLLLALAGCAAGAGGESVPLDTGAPSGDCPPAPTQPLVTATAYTFDWSAVTNDSEGAPVDPSACEGPLLLLWSVPSDPEDPDWRCSFADDHWTSVTSVQGPFDGQSSITVDLPPGEATHLVAMLRLATGLSPAFGFGALGGAEGGTTLALSAPPVESD